MTRDSGSSTVSRVRAWFSRARLRGQGAHLRDSSLFGSTVEIDTGQSPGHAVSAPSTIRSESVAQLAEALLACASVSHGATRNAIIDSLPAHIRHGFDRSGIAHTDVTNLVRRAANYEGGLAALAQAVRDFEGDSLPMQQVDEVMRRMTG